MDEKIVIAELDLETDALVTSASETSAELARLRNEQKELRKEGQQGSRQFQQNAANIQRLSEAYRAQTRTLAALTDETGQLNSVEDTLNELLNENITTQQQATESTRQLTRIRAVLNVETEEGAAATALINEKIEQNTQLQNENSDSVSQNRRNVGNYTDSIVEALRSQIPFNDSLEKGTGILDSIRGLYSSSGDAAENAADVTDDFASSQAAANAATNAGTKSLNLFRVALASTGIGAIVIALGSLIAFLTQTQRGIDFINTSLASLQAFLGQLLQPILALGEALFDAITQPQQALEQLGQLLTNFIQNRIRQFADSFRALGRIISGVFTLNAEEIRAGARDFANVVLEPLEEVQQALKGVAEGFREAGEAALEAGAQARRLQELRIENERYEIQLIRTNATLAAQAQLLQGLADEDTRSFEERTQAAEQFGQVQQELLNNELRAAQQREEIARRELEIAEANGTANRELERAAAETTAARIQLQGELAEAERENNERISRINQDRLERDLDFELDLTATRLRNNLAFITDEAENFEARRQRLTEANAAIDDSFQDQAAIIEGLAQRQIDFNELLNESDATRVQQQVRNLGLSEIIEGRVLEILRDRQDALADVASAEQQLQAQQREARADELELQQQVVTEARALRQASISAELEDLRNKGESELAIQVEQNQLELEEVQRQLREDTQLQISELNNRLQNEEITLEQFEQQRLLIEQRTNQQALRNEASFARQREEITRQVVQNELTLVAQGFATLAELAGEQSVAGRAAGIAQATIDTFRAANLALATIPPPFGAIQAAFAVSTGLSNVRQIASINTGNEYAQLATSAENVPTAEKGGLFTVGGNRHINGGTQFFGQDGTVFEAERDEMIGVMSRPAASAFMRFNNLFTPGVRGASFLQNGGIAARGNAMTDPVVLARLIGEQVAEQFGDLPVPILPIQDVIDEAQRVVNIENGANI